MLCTLLAIESIGVYILIHTSMIWSGFETILQEGEYNRKDKKNPVKEILSTIFWLIAVAVYLGWSFVTNNWELTWVVWPIAGVLFPVYLGIIRLIRKDTEI